MRIAVAGKGGAGKTTFSSTAARLLARAGHEVIAIDGDSNPNLHTALGVSRETADATGSLPTSVVARGFDGPALTISIDELLDAHSVAGPDGVRLLQMGFPQHADEGCMCSAHATVSALLADLNNRRGTVTVLDLEASPEHLSRGTARHADALVLVAEPYFRSLEAVRLQARLAAEMTIGRVAAVANKCRTQTDYDGVAEFCVRHEIELVAQIPWGDEVLDADAAATPLLEFMPDSAVAAAIQGVCDELVSSEGALRCA